MDSELTPRMKEKLLDHKLRDSRRVEHVTFAPPRKPGQQPKYTPARVRKICDYVAMGLPYVHACAAVGIAPHTLDRWRKEKPEFVEALRAAEAEFMHYHLGVIDQSQDPQVSMKLLKARFPEHFSDRVPDLPPGASVNIFAEIQNLAPVLEKVANANRPIVIDGNVRADDLAESVHTLGPQAPPEAGGVPPGDRPEDG